MARMSKWKFGAKSKRELEGVHPDLVMCVQYALALSPVDFSVLDGLRTKSEQEQLVARGVSRTMRSRHLKSTNGWGHAVDLVPYINGKPRWEWPPIFEVAQAMQQAGQEYGVSLRWGGVWDRRLGRLSEDLQWESEQYADRRRQNGKRVFLDGPHFELPRGKVYP